MKILPEILRYGHTGIINVSFLRVLFSVTLCSWDHGKQLTDINVRVNQPASPKNTVAAAGNASVFVFCLTIKKYRRVICVSQQRSYPRTVAIMFLGEDRLLPVVLI